MLKFPPQNPTYHDIPVGAIVRYVGGDPALQEKLRSGEHKVTRTMFFHCLLECGLWIQEDVLDVIKQGKLNARTQQNLSPNVKVSRTLYGREAIP